MVDGLVQILQVSVLLLCRKVRTSNLSTGVVFLLLRIGILKLAVTHGATKTSI